MTPAKKRFGQNFLSDARYIDSIIRAVPENLGQVIVEVGPGQGAITTQLAAKAGKLIAVEIDRDLSPLLREKFAAYPHVSIVEQDFLKADLRDFAPDNKPLTIVGNLPYNVASLILLKLIKERALVKDAFVMLQREVGERITAQPGRKEFSFLSVAIGTFAIPKRLFLLPAGAFRPVPKVESAFLHIAMRQPGPGISDTEKYFALISHAFSQRRKKVINVLGRHYPPDTIQAFFRDKAIDVNARAESLSTDIYVELYRALNG